MPQKTVVFASVGPELTQYDLDVESAALSRRGTVTLPANVHYAWPHESQQFLYVASSDSASGIGGPVGHRHNVSAFRIDPATGALSPHGAPIALPTRPIHMTSDIPSHNLLVAFSNPSGIRVYRINPDGTPGAEVGQRGSIDPGIYGHQVRVSLDDQLAILVTRGHDAAGDRAGEAGGAEGVQLCRRTSEQRGFRGAEQWVRLWAPPSRFSSDQAVALCIAGAAESGSICLRSTATGYRPRRYSAKAP